VHVADRVADDQRADAADDQHHEHAQRVEQDRQPEVEVTGAEPRPHSREEVAMRRVLAEQADERDDGAGERDERRRRRDPAGDPSGDAHPGERDHEHRRERREEAEPGGDDHPRSALSLSTSRSSLRRDIATMSPRPTTTSDAATAITAIANTWPEASPL